MSEPAWTHYMMWSTKEVLTLTTRGKVAGMEVERMKMTCYSAYFLIKNTLQFISVYMLVLVAGFFCLKNM